MRVSFAFLASQGSLLVFSSFSVRKNGLSVFDGKMCCSPLLYIKHRWRRVKFSAQFQRQTWAPSSSLSPASTNEIQIVDGKSQGNTFRPGNVGRQVVYTVRFSILATWSVPDISHNIIWFRTAIRAGVKGRLMNMRASDWGYVTFLNVYRYANPTIPFEPAA